MSAMLPLSGITSELLKLVAKPHDGLPVTVLPDLSDRFKYEVKLVWFSVFAYLFVILCVCVF